MFAEPIKILKQLQLRENMIVADLGAGTGFYSILAGHMVPFGKVYAVEVNKDYLKTITHKIKEAHLKNVDIVYANIEKRGGIKLADATIDAVIASNILFQVEDKEGLLNEIHRILKIKGRVLVVDSDSPLFVGKHFISKENARAMFEKKGFVFDGYIDAGSHHYGIIFYKS